MLARIFLRFLRCSCLETMEMRLEVRMAWMLTSLRKYLAQRRKTSHSSSTDRHCSSTFSRISPRYSPNSSAEKNLRKEATFTYLRPRLALMKRMAEQNSGRIFSISAPDFPSSVPIRSTTRSDFSRLLKNEQNWFIMLDSLFFFALRISFSTVFSTRRLGLAGGGEGLAGRASGGRAWGREWGWGSHWVGCSHLQRVGGEQRSSGEWQKVPREEQKECSCSMVVRLLKPPLTRQQKDIWILELFQKLLQSSDRTSSINTPPQCSPPLAFPHLPRLASLRFSLPLTSKQLYRQVPRSE